MQSMCPVHAGVCWPRLLGVRIHPCLITTIDLWSVLRRPSAASIPLQVCKPGEVATSQLAGLPINFVVNLILLCMIKYVPCACWAAGYRE